MVSYLPFSATAEQSNVLEQIQYFLADDNDFLIVRGAAGTGKTSIMKAVSRYLGTLKDFDFVLLAPTGKAARNISQKTAYEASTLHSHLYSININIDNASIEFVPKSNQTNIPTVYIVDESSMLSNLASTHSEEYISETPLLLDLIKYVKASTEKSKIIFLGDTCQLAPYGYTETDTPPALSMQLLTNHFALKGTSVELSKVMRQAENSYILRSAYAIRDYILNPGRKFDQTLGMRTFNQKHAIETYLQYFDAKKHDKVAIVSMSKKYVKECNTAIRSLLGLENELTVGDRIILNKTFTSRQANIDNGENGIVMNTGKKTMIAGLTFLETEIKFEKNKEEDTIVHAQVMLDMLNKPETVTIEKKRELFALAMRNNPTFRNSRDLRDDVYLSAMNLSYGHALTCNKAQGSEWDTVILNSWIPPNTYNNRFLYTGITRARKNLYTNNAHLRL